MTTEYGGYLKPSDFEKAITSSSDYDDQIRSLVETDKSNEELFFELAITDIQHAADLFKVYTTRPMAQMVL